MYVGDGTSRASPEASVFTHGHDRKVYDELKAATAQARLSATAFQENMQALKSNWLLRGFFNRRGYQSSAELTKHEVRALPKHEYQQKFEYRANQLFERPDTAKLKNRKLLDGAGRFLETNPFDLAVVVAYTDMARDTEENRVLTQARAMVVRDALAENFGLDDTRIKTMGRGEDGRVPGGRIEILVYPRLRGESGGRPTDARDRRGPRHFDPRQLPPSHRLFSLHTIS